MSNVRFLALTVAALGLTFASAQAADINGKKGIGYAQAIGGPSGLAFNYGTGNLNVEGILGIANLGPKDGDGSLNLGLGLGVHYHALRSENAAFTVGGRINVGMTKNPAVVPSGGDQESITQFGLDIPMRVYWFADKHVSFHVETGISVNMEPEKGNLWPGGAGPEGTTISVFDGVGTFGNLGMTFWW